MLTVASPPVSEMEIELGARGVREAIEKARRGDTTTPRVAILQCYPASVSAAMVERPFKLFADEAQRDGIARDVRSLSVGSCSGVDFATSRSDAEVRAYGQQFMDRRIQLPDVHPDSWGPIIIRDPQSTSDRLAEVASNRYSYRQLDDFTDLIQRTLQRVPLVAKVQRAGVLPEQIYLDYSHERLASFDFPVARIKELLNARNVTAPAGVLETQTKNVRIDATAEFQSTREIGDVLVGTSSTGVPVYLRDLVSTWRGYQSPTQYLNYLTYRDASGTWQRNRAITLAVQMRSGEQIGDFGKAVDAAHRRRAAAAAARPDRRAHLGPAAAGERAGEPADGKPVGGDRARRDRRAGRLLGLALGAADGGLDPADAGHDLRDRPGDGHRHAAGLDRDADHRARAARGHAGGGGRRHQARAGPGIAAQPRLLDRPEQARQGDHLRHHHQHRRLPAVPAADRRHVLLPLQPAGRDERDAGRLGDRLVHLHPARRLLPDQAAEAGRGAHVRAAQARLRRVLLPRRRLRAPAPLGGVRRLAEHPGRGLALHVAAAPAVLPQGPVVSLVRGRLGAFRRAARGDERDRAQGRGRDPRGGGTLRRGAPREGRAEGAHHVRGRRRAALLVLGRSRAPAAQLRPDHRRGERQALHQRAGRPAADGAQPRGARGADRRPAARDGQAGRDPDLDPHLGRRHGGPAPALRASCRRSSARSPGRAGSATTGASRR